MKSRRSTPFHSSFAAAFSVAWLAHFTAPSASAANRFWSANGTSAGGNGTWDTSTLNRWGTAAAGAYTLAWVNGVDVAVLGTPVTTSLTLGENITCGGITAQNNNSGTGNINESASLYTLTLGITGNNVFSATQSTTTGRPLHINAVIVGASGANLVLNGPSVSSAATMSLNRANTFVGSTSFTGHSGGAVNLTLGHQLALQNSTLNLSTSCGTLAFNSSVAANAFTFGGLAGSGRNFALQNNAGVPAAIALSVGNNNANTSYSAVMSGPGSLVKIGTGTLTLSGSNTFSGTTTISDGKLQGVVGGSCVNSKVIINNPLATLGVSITDNTKTWTCKELAPTAAGAIEFDFGAITPSTSFSPLTITGPADFTTATPQVKVNVNAALNVGIYPLMSWNSVSGAVPSTAQLTPPPLLFETGASLEVSGNTLNLKIASSVDSAVKANNATNLNDGPSWIGGSAPSTTQMARWNSLVTSANTTTLGANLTWAGIIIENPTGPVTINGTQVLTIGAATIDIDMRTADTANLTINSPLALGAANNWNVSASRTLTLGGPVSGAFGVAKDGVGTAILSSGSNNYTGNTTVNAGTLKLGASNVIPNGIGNGNVSVAGTLDLNGQSEGINGLSGAGIIDNLAATTSTLTVGNNDQTSTFGGIIKNTTGILNLTKAGTGTFGLTGANTFSGAVTIGGGTLAVTNIAPFANVSGITIGDGTTLRPDITNAVINAPITLGAVATTSTISAPNVAGSGTTSFPFNLGGAVSGAGNLRLVGVSSSNAYGAINLKAASNYTGSTLITCSDELAAPTTLGNQNIFVRLFVTDALPVTTVLTLDGGDGAPLASAPGRYCELNLNGNNQTLAGLTNVAGRNLRVQRLVNNSATAATLTVNNALPHTYTGQLGWVSGFGSTAYNNFNLAKSGGGVQTLSGSLRYAGNTTVTGGTLSLGTANPNNELSTVTIGASGILQLTFTGSDTVDKLFINGIQQPLGTYGHSSTGATNGGGGSLDAYFATGTGTLNVTSGPGYASWQSANSTSQTIDLDHDGDGVKNGVEYFLGGNTNTTGFTALPGVTNTAGTLSITWTKGATYLGTYGTDFRVESSSTLTGVWTTETLGVNVTVTGNDVKYTFPAGTRNFARLRVTGP